MDGDMYESTMDQLFNLYEKIQVGGVIIVDIGLNRNNSKYKWTDMLHY